MRMPRLASLAAAAMLTALAGPTLAQDVQYRTVTKLDMGGAMNAMMELAGGSEVVETSYLKGSKLRTDVDRTSAIFDIEAGRYIQLDHEAKTFVSVPLDQIALGAAAMTGAVRPSEGQGDRGQLAATAVDEDGNKADFTFDMKIEQTDQRQQINGHQADRVFATVETDVKVTPEGETEAEDAGKLVIFMDVWNTDGGPAHVAVQRFHEAAAKEVAEQAFGNARGFGAAFAANPQMAEAMQRAAAESQKMDGLAVRTTIHMVVVAPGVAFDRSLVLEQPKSGAAEAAKSAAAGALRGMFGARREQPKQEEKEATQGTLFRMLIEIRDVETKSLPASLFEVPAGYREIAVGGGD